MKNLVSAIFCFCYAITITNAQQLLTPLDAEMIITIRAGEVFNKMSLSEIENMPYLKGYFNDIFKAIGHDASSFSEMGVDISKTSQLFIDIKEGEQIVMMEMSLPINDSEKFKTIFDFQNQPVKSLQGSEVIVKDGLSVVMSGRTALLTYALENPSHTSNNYYDDMYEEQPEEIEQYIMDEPGEVTEYEIAPDDIMEAPAEEIEEIREEPEQIEMMEPDYGVVEEQTEIESYNSYDYQEAKERERMKKEMEEKALVSEAYILELISDSKLSTSAPDFSEYEVDESADLSILIKDYGNILGMYQNWYSDPYSYNYMSMMGGGDIFSKMYNDIEYLTGNGYFRKDGMEIEFKQKFSDELAEMSRNFIGEFNKDMLKYIPFDSELGHISLAMDTKNTINSYYNLMEMYMSTFLPEQKEMMEASMAFARILIDEEALGKLYKGDAYFGVTDLNSYELEYTTYEYDDNWNSTEVTKTKQEIRPDFLLMFSSEEYDLINKILKVIAKETRDEFRNMGDYYHMAASRQVPLDIYCMHKDGIVFVFTSQSLFDSIMKGGAKAKSSDAKMITDNFFSMSFDAQKLFSKIPLEDMSEKEKELILSARENLGEFRMTQEKMTGNTMTSKFFMESNGDYSNSLEYFINLFNELGRIEDDFRYNRN